MKKIQRRFYLGGDLRQVLKKGMVVRSPSTRRIFHRNRGSERLLREKLDKEMS